MANKNSMNPPSGRRRAMATGPIVGLSKDHAWLSSLCWLGRQGGSVTPYCLEIHDEVSKITKAPYLRILNLPRLPSPWRRSLRYSVPAPLPPPFRTLDRPCRSAGLAAPGCAGEPISCWLRCCRSSARARQASSSGTGFRAACNSRCQDGDCGGLLPLKQPADVRGKPAPELGH